jgi:hypothetical protein
MQKDSRLSDDLFRKSVSIGNKGVPSCYGVVSIKDSGGKPAALFSELMQILYHADWTLEGSRHERDPYPPEVTILAGSDHGEAFDCG